MYLENSDTTTKRLRSLTGQSKGPVKVEVRTEVWVGNREWGGGSHSRWIAINMANMEVAQLPPPSYEEIVAGSSFVTELVPGFGLIEVGEGTYRHITLNIHPDNAPMLPTDEEGMTYDELVVLYATRSLKNSYGGRNDIRFTESQRMTGITRKRWNDAVSSLIGHRMLRKNGSITVRGKNMVEGVNSWPKEMEVPQLTV